ncbi:PAS domain S-box protein [Phormidesmis sp. 146-12]
MTTQKLTDAAKEQFFQLSIDLLCIAGFDGYLKQLNPAWQKTLGFTLEELQSTPFIEFVHPDDRAATLAEAEKITQGIETVSFENRCRCRDGSYKWLSWAATAVSEQHLFYVVAHDISQRKQAEAELQRSQQKLALLIQQSPIGVIEWNTQFEVVAWNLAAAMIFGYSSDEAIGQTAEFLLTETAKPHVDHWQQLLTQKGGNRSTHENLTKQGTTIACEWYNTPLIDAAGQVIGAASLVVDVSSRQQAEITLQQANEKLEASVIKRTVELQQVIAQLQAEIGDRTKAETQLQNSQQLLQSIIDNTSACIFVKEYLHTDGTYLLINRQFETLFNCDRKRLNGKTDYDIFPHSVAKTLRDNDRQVMEGGNLFQIEETVPHADGLHTSVVVKVPLLNDDNQIYGICGIATDITDRVRGEEQRQQAEDALRQSESQLRQQTQQLEQTLQDLKQAQAQLVQTEKMSSLGQLVAGVAHEINNPVSFIYGNVNHADEYTQDLMRLIALYQSHYPDPIPAIAHEVDAIDLDFLMADLPKLMASMKLGAERIQEIVLSLRTFSRMDESDMKAVNIHEGIDSTLMILQNQLKKQPNYSAIQIIRDYGELPLVECYAGQLNQVFMNILSNAIDALNEGNRDWRVIRIRTEIDCSDVTIWIADNGCGMSQSAKQRVFDPFFTTKPIGKGTGLGLSISYQIITEKHKGSLQCISSPDNGTEFMIKIPIRQTLGDN